MRFDRFVGRWVGVTLTLIGVVSIIWLGSTGRLELYIHPRYTAFTMVMAVIGGAAAISAFLVMPGRSDDESDHDHGHDDDHGTHRPGGRARAVLAGLASVTIVAAALVALLVLPPSSLSSSIAQSRDLTATTGTLDSGETPQLVGGDTSTFTVKDWASLLRQGAGMDYLAGKSAEVSGFVVPSNDEDVYYLARFVITCCAVDAQPIGVPVYEPGWQDHYDESAWLAVTGGFIDNPDASADNPIVLEPTSTESIDEPAQPYVY